jgi:molybdopterin synthase catalytic subunit
LPEIYSDGLDIGAILARWHVAVAAENLGAFASFVGTVRAENDISALSFDIYSPLLIKWFNGWQEKAKGRGAIVFMAHAKGDVSIGASSYIAAIASPKRRVALEMIEAFVEDFKKNAPIWKYDVIDGRRVFAADRAFDLPHSGMLSAMIST